MKPLAGITVLALEQAVAAPLCTRMLAERGARVVKIERPQGGDFARAYDTRVRGLSSHFVWANRSKESLTLDLKHPAAADVLERLLARSDVLVQNLAPGAAARLGLSYEALQPRHPRLVVCDISGYGDDPRAPGPYRERKAYDLLIQSESGLLSVTGTDAAPAKAGIAIADIAAAVTAQAEILAALLARATSGRGRRIDVSMLEAMADWMGFPLYYAFDGAPAPARSGAAHATIAPYGPVRTADGVTLMLAVQNEREWRALCTQVLRQPSLADDAHFAGNAARHAARAELDAIVAAGCAALDACALRARLDEAGIAYAQVNDMQALWRHPQLAARGRWTEVDTPAGPVPALLPAGADEGDAAIGPVPALGQHTDRLLAELGYTHAEAAALRAAGAV
jgi:itaconate CoA-transferase